MYKYSTNFFGKVPALTFHQFKGMESVITCYNNPSLETMPLLKEVYGINMLITTIKHNYQIYLANLKCKEANIKYNNFLINTTNKVLDKSVDINLVIRQIKEIFNIIKNEKITLLINSASGVFSASILAYCLLRMSGENRVDALSILTNLRLEQNCRLGEYRYEFAENKLVKKLIEPELITIKNKE